MQNPPPLPPINPYAAPAARLEHYQTNTLVLADPGQRLGAAILDYLAFAAVAIAAAIFLPVIGRNNEIAVIIGVVIMLLTMLAILLINIRLLRLYGQTIGKRMLDIRVVRSDGGPCDVGRYIVARWLPINIIGVIPLLGPLTRLIDVLMIFGADRRCLHDLIADTIVVKN
jgi:uncharacterized RDD family membrane protein YckC